MKPRQQHHAVRTRVFFISGIVMAAALASCGGKIMVPDLTLDKIGIEKIGISGMNMHVYFDVMNVNRRAITVKFIEYQLEVNGKRVGKGYFNEEVTLGEMERKQFKSTMKVSFFKLPGAIKSIFDNKTVHGKVKGKFTLRGVGGNKVLPFDSEADIPISKF